MVDTPVGSLYDGPHVFARPGFEFRRCLSHSRYHRVQRSRCAGCGADSYAQPDTHSDNHSLANADPHA
jgi:hypothetical protein